MSFPACTASFRNYPTELCTERGSWWTWHSGSSPQRRAYAVEAANNQGGNKAGRNNKKTGWFGRAPPQAGFCPPESQFVKLASCLSYKLCIFYVTWSNFDSFLTKRDDNNLPVSAGWTLPPVGMAWPEAPPAMLWWLWGKWIATGLRMVPFPLTLSHLAYLWVWFLKQVGPGHTDTVLQDQLLNMPVTTVLGNSSSSSPPATLLVS